MDYLAERRRHPRYPIHLPVFIFFSEKRVAAHTLDLGRGGMKIHADQTIPAGQEFLLQLVLEGKPIWSKGRFLFNQTQPDLVNFSCIQFVNTPEKNIHLLQEYLSPLEKGNEDRVAVSNQYGEKCERSLPPSETRDLDPGQAVEDFSDKFKKRYTLLKEKYIDTLVKKNLLQKELIKLEAELAAAQASLRMEGEERKRGEQILRELEERQRNFLFEFLEAQEKEKEELHAGIGVILSVLKDGLENIVNLMKEGPIAAQIPPEQIMATFQKGAHEIRRILTNLRPSVLDDLGILPTIDWYCREFQNIYPGIRMEKEIDIQEEEITELLKIVIFRVLQEGLNNMAKHSRGDRVRISLIKQENRIRLAIEDNGQGFDLQDMPFKRKGLGLTGMKARTELSGGSLAIESAKSSGTVIRASWPYRRMETN
jgi:two-component sensor histidine kinase